MLSTAIPNREEQTDIAPKIAALPPPQKGIEHLRGILKKRPVFLLCGGPSLARTDLTLLNQRGLITMAINNAAALFRPHYFIAIDEPKRFVEQIWKDPAICKLIPRGKLNHQISERDEGGRLESSSLQAGGCPNTFGFPLVTEFAVEAFLEGDGFCAGNKNGAKDELDITAARSTFLVALKMLFYLGASDVYLIGADFNMQDGAQNYAFEQETSAGNIKANNVLYTKLQERLQALEPHFEAAGFNVWNCTPESGLTVFPKLDYAVAVTKAARECNEKPIQTGGMYQQSQGQPPKQIRRNAEATLPVHPKDMGFSKSHEPDIHLEDSETTLKSDISSQTWEGLPVLEKPSQERRNLNVRNINVRTPHLIPRQFHWVWLGVHPLPEKDQKWMRSWQEKHPGWQCTLWAEHPENIRLEDFEVRPLPPLINQKFYHGIEQWVTGLAATASRSDIVRYEVLLQGGIYLDTDVECFGNIEHLLCGVSLFVADEWGPCCGNYMFGASPNHPALYTVVRELGSHLTELKTAVNAVIATGPNYLNERLRSHPDLVIFPHMIFNPLCAYDDPEKVTQWPAVSLANHHFDGKWYDRIKNDPPKEFQKESL